MRAFLATAALALLLRFDCITGAFVDNSDFMITTSQKLKGKRSKDTPPQSPDSKTQLEPLTVQTTEGSVIGDYPQWNMQTTNLFYGCRAWKGLNYAQQPVGALRFKAPLPAQPYTTQPFEAVNFKPPCAQFRRGAGSGDFGSEECLGIDIYSPVTAPVPAKHPNGYPVLVYFHGGFYTFGGTSSNDGVPFAKKDTVVVVVAFRLGIFGAMLSQDGTTFPGNQHLLDQQLALRWIQANIRSFDGDKGQVTLMGSSTGSSDILCHMTSPDSQGLFAKVILNSAYFVQRYDTEADTKAVAQAAITQINCGGAVDPNACIALTKNTTELVDLQSSYFISGVYTGPGCQTDHHRIFGPFVQAGGVLPRQPLEAFRLGLVSDVPVVTGTVRAEGGTQTFNSIVTSPITTEATFRQWLATRFGPQNVDQLVELYPFPNPKIYHNNTDYRFAIQDMFGDYWRQCPQLVYMRAAQAAPGLGVMKQSTYVYLVRFTPTNNYATQIDAKTGCQNFICHGDSLSLIWADAATVIYEADAHVARSMNSAVNNFVHTSDPNTGAWAAQVTNKYPNFQLHTQKLGVIDYPKAYVGKSSRVKQCQFWDSFSEP